MQKHTPLDRHMDVIMNRHNVAVLTVLWLSLKHQTMDDCDVVDLKD